MQTVDEFAARCASIDQALLAAQREGVGRAALTITRGIRDQIRAVTGDSRLSGVGRGARVGAKYTVLSGGDAIIQATGPLHLIERPTRAHEIEPRGRRRSRGNRRPALYLGGSRFYARVHARGTRGKRPFAKGIAASAPQATRQYQAEITRRAWRHLLGSG